MAGALTESAGACVNGVEPGADHNQAHQPAHGERDRQDVHAGDEGRRVAKPEAEAKADECRKRDDVGGEHLRRRGKAREGE